MRSAICLLALFWSFVSFAEESSLFFDHPQPVRISIIIDDVGDNWQAAKRLLELPGPVAMAILPGSPYAERVATEAAKRGKPVMLHMPMHTHDHRELGPLGLTLEMNEWQVKERLRKSIASIPNIMGVNNHMGSLLTRHPGHMRWVMEVISEYKDLFFVDSRTTLHTVAYDVAQENGILSTSRDVFLDPDKSLATVEKQWKWLLQLANRQGYAVAIGHPYPNTIKVLERELAKLFSEPSYRFVQINVLAHHAIEGSPLWQHASLYPSQPGLKSSKPLP